MSQAVSDWGQRKERPRRRVWVWVVALTWLMSAGCSDDAGKPIVVPPRFRAPRVVAPVPPPKPEPEVEEPEPPDSPIPFRLPAGYVAERVAAPPLIKHPMFASFDDRGRLYVAGSSGHNLDGRALTADPPDAIRCLEDTDGDGRFDRSTVFADRLTYPQGVLWHNGSVYTASPPSLWRLEDTDGDGVADKRTEMVTGFPFTGIADDLHGPRLGPDGRLYWGVGRFEYNVRKPGGPLIHKGETPLIMRCRPDGEEIEVFSAAMGNPVGIAFSPEGEPIACGTFLSPQVQGEGLRDAIIHCVYGGLYSVRDRDLSGEKNTGGLLPPLAQLGVAAGSGMTIARGGRFGTPSRPELYSAMFNLHSVTRHVLTRDGSTFRVSEEPFLQSDVTDFHPTDVVEDADGSLLVVDTGGWFRSCPTSQIAKPDVRGAIYRIRRQFGERRGVSGKVQMASARTAKTEFASRLAARTRRGPTDPRGLKLDWSRPSPAELARRLTDFRFAVRDRATAQLASLGKAAFPELRGLLRHGWPRVRARAIWVAARIDGDGARAFAREALLDTSPDVRLTAATVVGLRRDDRAVDRLREMARSDVSLPVRREAATALGRLRLAEAVPSLLEGLRAANDRFLDHALIYALIEIDDRAATIAGLSDPSSRVRRGALIALDQMPGGDLTLDLVSPLLAATDPELQQAALRVVADHPEWASAMAETLGRWLAGGDQRVQQADLRRQLRAFTKAPAVKAVIAEALGRPSTPAPTRAMLLEVIASVPTADWPPSWDFAVGLGLGDADESVARQAVAAGALSKVHFVDALLAIARDGARGDELRVAAAEVVTPLLTNVEAALFNFLVARIGTDEPPMTRLAAARALGRASLDDAQLLTLASVAGGTGVMTLHRVLPAFIRSHDPKVGTALVTSLGQSPGLTGLSGDDIENAVRGFPTEVRHKAEPLLRRIALLDGERESRLAEAESTLTGGDAARGREVFFSARASCSSCHTVRSEGGQIGPNLSKIGAARTVRDILEAIMYPSASFARGYEPYLVATDDGRVLTGIIARESGSSIVLVAPDHLETTLPRWSIESIEPGRVSIMPQGLDANLRRSELADLVAFLHSLK